MVAGRLLAVEKDGRGRVSYVLGPEGDLHVRDLIEKSIRWFRFLGRSSPWDRRWMVVVFSIPETLRKRRDLLRAGLVERGFGQLSPGVWISPSDRRQEVRSLGTSLGATGMISLLLSDELSVFGSDDPRKIAETVWTLKALRKRYDEFNRYARNLLNDIEDETGKDREGLFFRGIDLQGEFMEIILDEDPCLPKELLPSDDWPGLPAHDLFHRLVHVLSTMEPMSATYGYLFHLVPGMEQVIEYHGEGEFDFHRPDD